MYADSADSYKLVVVVLLLLGKQATNIGSQAVRRERVLERRFESCPILNSPNTDDSYPYWVDRAPV